MPSRELQVWRALWGRLDVELTQGIVLGLNGQGGARRLAQLLLADPLSAEESWEKELVKVGDGSEKAVLLKCVHT